MPQEFRSYLVLQTEFLTAATPGQMIIFGFIKLSLRADWINTVFSTKKYILHKKPDSLSWSSLYIEYHAKNK